MELAGNVSCILNHIPGVFPQVEAPGIGVTDFLINATALNTQNQQGIKSDPNSKCATAHPIFVPHDQDFGDVYNNDHPECPNLVFDAVITDSNTSLDNFPADGWGFSELRFMHPEGAELGASAYVHATLDGSGANTPTQGLLFLWQRQVTNALGVLSQLAFRFKVVDGATEYLFSLSTGVGLVPQLGLSFDGGSTWTVVNSGLKADGSLGAVMGNTGDRAEIVKVTLLNFTLQINVGGDSTPFVYEIPWASLDPPLISEAAILATHFTELRLSIHPLKWGTEDFLTSAPINMGFAPPAACPYRIHGLTEAVVRASGNPWGVAFPAGSEIVVERPFTVPYNSINQAYTLKIRNPVAGTYAGEPYAHWTAAVTRVTVLSHGVWTGTNPAWNQPEELAAYGKGLKEVREDIALDLNSLSIQHRVSIILDNFYGGSGLSGDRSGWQGNKAVNLQLGYLSPFLPLQQRFVGIIRRAQYSRPSNSQAYLCLSAEDQMCQLAGKQNFSPPDLDGWNHYAAIAFLAQLGKIHATQMSPALRQRVATEGGGTLWTHPNDPIDPYSFTGADPSPYFLPLGQGMNPWTPRNRAMSVLALMNHVRAATGYLLYFDAGGYLRYEEWIPPTAGSVKKVFTEGVTGIDGGNLTEFWDPVVTSSTEDVRNQVLIIGTDAFSGSWRPIVVKQEDTPSIRTPTAPNYVGWEAPFVWADSKFADFNFASEAAMRVLRFMRVPCYEASFETWMQPTLFPMDVIWLQERKTGIASLPLYITRMTNIYTVVDGSLRMRSQISGRYITL